MDAEEVVWRLDDATVCFRGHHLVTTIVATIWAIWVFVTAIYILGVVKPTKGSRRALALAVTIQGRRYCSSGFTILGVQFWLYHCV